MDPKSLAANTATLLGLTIQVTGALYGDWDSTSLPTVDRLLYELVRLRNVLSSLEETSLESDGAVRISINRLPKVFKSLKSILIFLGSRLLGDGTFLDIPSPNSLSWAWEIYNPNKAPQTLPLSINDREEIFNEFRVLIPKLRDEISEALVDAPSEITNEPSKNLVSLKPEFRKDRADYNAIHATAQENRVEGSGVWLLSHPDFQRWINSHRIDPKRQDNVLYCFGRPGSGKTVLASVVVDELRSVRRGWAADTGLAYFYFSYRIQTSIYKVILALLEQFYLQSPTTPTEIQELEARRAKPREMPLVDLITILLSVLSRFRTAYIVLDALDECSADSRTDLATLIGSIRGSQCRLFLTTRPSYGSSDFQSCPQIPIVPSVDDMRLFVRARLEQISEQEKLFTKSQEDIILEVLVNMGKRHGMFLLVELQINSISKMFASGIPEDFNLSESLSKLVGDLFTVYDSQIHRITSQSEADSKLAGNVLSWLYYTYRPLTSPELEDVLEKEVAKWKERPTNPVDATSIRKVCLDLVRFAPNTQVMSFFHFSFQEYLEKGQVERRALPLDEVVIAEACMECLIDNSKGPPKAASSTIGQTMLHPPFYQYAALYWGHHLRRAIKNLPDLNFRTMQLCRTLVTDVDTRSAVCDVMFLDKTVSSHERDEYLAPNNPKPSPIHFVAFFDLVEPRFLELGINDQGSLDTATSTVEHMGRTAFHIVAERGFSASLQVLLNFPNKTSSVSKRIALINRALTSTDKLLRNVWHYAALGGHEKVLGLLIRQLTAGQLTSVENVQKIATRDIQGKTPLAWAASGGHLKCLKLLLDRKIYLEDTEDSLLAAVQHGHSNAVKLFLECGIASNHQHLLAAIKSGVEDSVKLLLDYGLKIDSKAQGSALHEAALKGQKPILSSLIWNGADLEIEDSENRTPLSIAVEKGDIESVKALLEAGSDPDVTIVTKSDVGARPGRKINAIAHAAEQGMVEIFQLLKRAGADGSDTFFPAIEHGQYGIVKLHLEAGVSPYAESKNGSAIAVAAESGHQDLVRLLQNWEHKKSCPERFATPEDEMAHSLSHIEDLRSVQQSNLDEKVVEGQIPVSDLSTEWVLGSVGDVKFWKSRNRESNRDSVDSRGETKKEASMTISTRGDTLRSHSLEHINIGTRHIIDINTDSRITTGSRDGIRGAISVPPPIQSVSATPPSLNNLPANLLKVSSKLQATTKRTPSTFILLDSPILEGNLQLGALVRDPRRPLTAFTPSDQAEFRKIVPEKFIHRLHQSNFQLSSERSRQGSASLSMSVAAWQTNVEKSARFQIVAPDVWRVQLRNHEEILNAMVADERYRREVIAFLKGGTTAYLIVGFFIMNQSMIKKDDDSGASMGGDVGFDVGIPGMSMGPKVGQANSAMFSVAYDKVLIHGIQYRSIRMRKKLFGLGEQRLELEGYVEGAGYEILR